MLAVVTRSESKWHGRSLHQSWEEVADWAFIASAGQLIHSATNIQAAREKEQLRMMLVLVNYIMPSQVTPRKYMSAKERTHEAKHKYTGQAG